jgi:catechol 2,3-dioxygenase-like lactoylglutathione lyase family enzyme
MLQQSASTHPMVAVKDLDSAKEFYSGTLGFVPFEERPGAAIRYETRGATWFMIYQSAFAGDAKTTCMKFEVEDVYATVRELRERGVVFEEYDLPGLKTIDGVAEHSSGARGAWFKDPDGNILQIGQYSS